MNKFAIFFSLILLCISSCSINDPKSRIQGKDTVLIVLMDFNKELAVPVSKKVTEYYQIPVKIIEAPLPAYAYFAPRNRYRADSIIQYLGKLNKGEYRFVAGLTSKDISTTKGKIADWGVFGLGSLSGKGCIASSFRLSDKSYDLLIERLQKVILHELGHNHGLPHCTSKYPCFMKDAEGKVSVVDNEPMNMCKDCLDEL